MTELGCKSGIVEDIKHGVVFPQGLGHEPFDAMAACLSGQTLQKETGQTLPVVRVVHYEGHLRLITLWRAIVLGDGDDVVTPESHQGEIVASTQMRESIDLLL
jgi:hypothetical protein